MSEKKLQFNQEWLAWISEIVRDRISSEIELVESDEFFYLHHNNQDVVVKIGPINSNFRGMSSKIEVDLWNPSFCNAPLWHERIVVPKVLDSEPLICKLKEDEVFINFDLIGFISWHLLRVEELSCTKKDQYDRFPSVQSNAFRFDYLDRPVVDEALGVLTNLLKLIWFEFVPENKDFQVLVSHDIDRPNTIGPTGFDLIAILNGVRSIVADVVKFGDFSFLSLARRSWNPFILSSDHQNSFEWIMDRSEELGLRSSFHFICGRTDVWRDCSYNIDHYSIREVLRKISDRGHEICLHPSFRTHLDPNALEKEALKLRLVLDEEGLSHGKLGSRMHYLKLKIPETYRYLERTGIYYDASLGYSDVAGFRAGTCFEYPFFDIMSGKKLNLRVRPLIFMEASILSARDLDHVSELAAIQKINTLKDRCRSVGGSFTVLWHNCEFFSEQRKKIYIEAIG